jgi:hypothetical protein
VGGGAVSLGAPPDGDLCVSSTGAGGEPSRSTARGEPQKPSCLHGNTFPLPVGQLPSSWRTEIRARRRAVQLAVWRILCRQRSYEGADGGRGERSDQRVPTEPTKVSPRSIDGRRSDESGTPPRTARDQEDLHDAGGRSSIILSPARE